MDKLRFLCEFFEISPEILQASYLVRPREIWKCDVIDVVLSHFYYCLLQHYAVVFCAYISLVRVNGRFDRHIVRKGPLSGENWTHFFDRCDTGDLL